jgi:hypothetical protein
VFRLSALRTASTAHSAAMRQIIAAILASPVPVATYVAPRSAFSAAAAGPGRTSPGNTAINAPSASRGSHAFPDLFRSRGRDRGR